MCRLTPAPPGGGSIDRPGHYDAPPKPTKEADKVMRTHIQSKCTGTIHTIPTESKAKMQENKPSALLPQSSVGQTLLLAPGKEHLESCAV